MQQLRLHSHGLGHPAESFHVPPHLLCLGLGPWCHCRYLLGVELNPGFHFVGFGHLRSDRCYFWQLQKVRRVHEAKAGAANRPPSDALGSSERANLLDPQHASCFGAFADQFSFTALLHSQRVAKHQKGRGFRRHPATREDGSRHAEGQAMVPGRADGVDHRRPRSRGFSIRLWSRRHSLWVLAADSHFHACLPLAHGRLSADVCRLASYCGGY